MRIAVQPRYVAAPWEQSTGRRVRVGREAEVRPEPGPLALYQAHFPDRDVVWDPELQLFVIVNRPGYPHVYDRVFFWDAEPEDPERPFTAEEITEMVERGDGRPIRRFLPFDYDLVRRRIREQFEFYGLGADKERKHIRRIADHNAGVQRKVLRERDQLFQEWAQDDKRWLPVLAALHAGERPDAALTAKVPLIQPGIALTIGA